MESIRRFRSKIRDPASEIGGPVHNLGSTLHLGAGVDAEANAQAPLNGTGDDNAQTIAGLDDEEEINLAEFIDIKGMKAQGNQLTKLKVKDVESLPKVEGEDWPDAEPGLPAVGLWR